MSRTILFSLAACCLVVGAAQANSTTLRQQLEQAHQAKNYAQVIRIARAALRASGAQSLEFWWIVTRAASMRHDLMMLRRAAAGIRTAVKADISASGAHRAMLDTAWRTYRAGDYRRALVLARDLLHLTFASQGSRDVALTLACASACQLRQAPDARDFCSRVSSPYKHVGEEVCRQRGVPLR